MTSPKINTIDSQIDRLVTDGYRRSAERLLSATVSGIVRTPYVLLQDTKYLVHYTSVDTLFSLLSCPADPHDTFALSLPHSKNRPPSDPRYLRLYDTYNFTDPNEGHFFVHREHQAHRFSETHSDLWALLQRRTQLPAYVTSFRGLSRLEDADSLLFWRTYGKEARGCAIVFPVSFLADCTPLRVQYGSKAVIATLDHLAAVFDSLDAMPTLRRHHLLYRGHDPLPKYVSSSLSPIPYLHKTCDYAFEDEIRIAVPFEDLHPDILYCHRTYDNTVTSRLRHFATVPDLHIHNILRTGSRIILGPAVPSRTNLRFVLKERLANQQLVETKICFSKKAYRS